VRGEGRGGEERRVKKGNNFTLQYCHNTKNVGNNICVFINTQLVDVTVGVNYWHDSKWDKMLTQLVITTMLNILITIWYK